MYRVTVLGKGWVSHSGEYLTILKLCKFLGGGQRVFHLKEFFYFDDEEAARIFTEALDNKGMTYQVEDV